jgi:hypothetical protein
MELKNRFHEEDKARVWTYRPYCQECGSNRLCSLHHICGTISDSILNSIMLCNIHHKKADGHNVSDRKFQQRYIKMTLKIAKEEGYILVDRDKEFLDFCSKNNIVL